MAIYLFNDPNVNIAPFTGQCYSENVTDYAVQS